MKHLSKIIFAAFAVLALSASFTATASAQSAGVAHVVLVDFNRVTVESLVGQDVSAQLDANRARMETRAAALDAQLQTEGQELQRQESIMAPDAFEERVNQFQQRQLNARNELEGLNAQHQRAAQQASLEIQRILRPIVMEVMTERGGTIVMDKGQVYHSVGGLDATTDVIDRLNAQISGYQVVIPQGTAAAPAQ